MLIFSHLEKDNILCREFKEFKKNNSIEFGKKKIALCYAPNGTGKTTFSKILDNYDSTSYSVKYKDIEYTKGLFHVIADQNNRNIIKGETEEFILRDNIKKERELEIEIKKEFDLKYSLIKEQLSSIGITKKSDILVTLISDIKIKEYVENLVNIKNKGKSIDLIEFSDKLSSILEFESANDSIEYKYVLKNLNDKDSILNQILNIKSIDKHEDIVKVEENQDALNILKKYSHKKECVVCDSEINNTILVSSKNIEKEKIISTLSEKLKLIIKDILEKINQEDPLNLKKRLISAIESGINYDIEELRREVETYKKIFNLQINEIFRKNNVSQEIIAKISEYDSLVKNTPQIDEEDFCLIKTLIEENIEKKLSVIREEKEIKIKLDNIEILGGNKEFDLSAGEQNFLSLSFELLKANKQEKKIVVMDDPISSFDSIYKNKIAFLIVKLFEHTDKKVLLLTHNLELPRLLLHQIKNNFNFYLLNNKEVGDNGFIRVNDCEVDLLMYLDKLTAFFRENIINEIENKKNFLISMIPFMRGYANIVGNNIEKNNLTNLMHGYINKEIDISKIYFNLFGLKIYEEEIKVKVEDILSIDLNSLSILKESTEFKILKKTLNHSLIYLFLRLKVEETLVKKYSINTKKYDMLSQIIQESYKGNDEFKKKNRIFLNSKKTLLNEFNHFEGNLSIFQPAIDITDKALEKEKMDIIEFLESRV